MSQPPQTGDPVVDEVIDGFRATSEESLGDRAAAAAQAQRLLQERLTGSSPGNTASPGNTGSPGNTAASGIQRVAGATPSS